MTIKISGRGTFEHREKIKEIGAMWNGVDRVWTVPDNVSSVRLERLRQLPGLVITMPDGSILMGGSGQPERAERREPSEPQPFQGRRSSTFEQVLARLAARESGPVEYYDQPTRYVGDDQTHVGLFERQAPRVFAGFSSWSVLLDYVENLPDECRHGSRGSGWREGAGFAGTASMEETFRLARHGWRRGVQIAKEAAEVITSDHAQQRRRTHSVAGGRVNVGRMLAGSPDHMVQRRHRDGTKVITLYVAMGMLAVVEAPDAALRAACIAAMCDLLELSGYSCEIIGVHDSMMTGERVQPGIHIAVPIKRAGDQMNIEDMVFALGHPSVMRRLIFSIMGSVEELRPMWGGMGATISCFTKNHPPPKNSYYIAQLQGQQIKGGNIPDRVRSLFPHILPDDFPVDLSE